MRGIEGPSKPVRKAKRVAKPPVAGAARAANDRKQRAVAAPVAGAARAANDRKAARRVVKSDMPAGWHPPMQVPNKVPFTPKERREISKATNQLIYGKGSLLRALSGYTAPPKTPLAAKGVRDSRDVSVQREAQKRLPEGERTGPMGMFYKEGEDNTKPGLLSADNRLAAAKKIVDGENWLVKEVKKVPGAKQVGAAAKEVAKGASYVGEKGVMPLANIAASQVADDPMVKGLSEVSKHTTGIDLRKTIKNVPSSTKELIVTTPTNIGMLGNEALFGKGPAEAAKQGFVDPVVQIAKHPKQMIENDPAAVAAVVGGLRLGTLGGGRFVRGVSKGKLLTTEGGVRPLPGTAFVEPVNRSRYAGRNAVQAGKAKWVKGRKKKAAARPAGKEVMPITEWTDALANAIDPNRPLVLPKGMRGGVRTATPVHNGRNWVIAQDAVTRPSPKYIGSRNKVVRATDELVAQLGNRHQRQMSETEAAVKKEFPVPKRRKSLTGEKRKARLAAKGERLTEMSRRHAADAETGVGVDKLLTADKFGSTTRPLIGFEQVKAAEVRKATAEADAKAAREAEKAARDTFKVVAATVRSKPVLTRAAYETRPGNAAAVPHVNMKLNALAADRSAAIRAHNGAKASTAAAATRLRVLKGMRAKGTPVSHELLTKAEDALRTAKDAEAAKETAARVAHGEWAAENARMQGVHPNAVNQLLSAVTDITQAGKKGKAARAERSAAHQDLQAVRARRREGGVVDVGSPQVYAHMPDAAMAAARAPHDSIVQKVAGDKAAGVPDTYVVVPRIVSGRIAAHKSVATSPQPGAVGLRMLRSGLTRAVLPLSSTWIAGQIAEPAARGLMRGTNPVHHPLLIREVLKELDRRDPVKAQTIRDNLFSGGQIAQLEGMASKKKASEYVKKMTDQDASLMHYAADRISAQGSTKGDTAVQALKSPFNAYNTLADKIFHGNVKGIERPAQHAFAGQELTKLPAAEGMVNPHLKHNIQKLADALEQPVNQTRVLRGIDNSYGKYGRHSPAMRSYMAHWAPFAPWPIAALKLMLKTMPKEHPGRTAIAGLLEIAYRDERAKEGLSTISGAGTDKKNSGSIGAVVIGGKKRRTNRILPFGLFVGDPGDTAGRIIGPSLQSAYRAWNGLDLYNNKIRDPKTGKELTLAGKLKLWAYTMTTSTVPLASPIDRGTGVGEKYVTHRKPRPGWDSYERLMQFLDPTRPYPDSTTPEQALKELKSAAKGGGLDPEVLKELKKAAGGGGVDPDVLKELKNASGGG